MPFGIAPTRAWVWLAHPQQAEDPGRRRSLTRPIRSPFAQVLIRRGRIMEEEVDPLASLSLQHRLLLLRAAKVCGRALLRIRWW
jgi:hypothetical protein